MIDYISLFNEYNQEIGICFKYRFSSAEGIVNSYYNKNKIQNPEFFVNGCEVTKSNFNDWLKWQRSLIKEMNRNTELDIASL